MPIFSTPTVRRVLDPRDPLFRHRKYKVGLSVLQQPDGTFVTVEGPEAADVEAALRYYAGGRVHTITDEEASALAAAGYAVDPDPK